MVAAATASVTERVYSSNGIDVPYEFDHTPLPGLASLLLDSQNLGKLNYVKCLNFVNNGAPGVLVGTLIQRSPNLRDVHVSIKKDDTFFFSLAGAPSLAKLVSLRLTVEDGTSLDILQKLQLDLPCLEKLHIQGTNKAMYQLLTSLTSKSGSGSRLNSLSLQGLASGLVADLIIRMDSGSFTSKFESLRTLSIEGLIHPDTFLALSGGLFGRQIDFLSIWLDTFNFDEPENEDPLQLDKIYELPANLRFDLPKLRVLLLGGAFHSTIMDAFGTSKSTVPGLEEVDFTWTGQSVGPVPLSDYTFADHIVPAIDVWAIDNRTSETWNQWLPFIKLAENKKFRPLAVKDKRDLKPAAASLSEGRPWRFIARMKSIDVIERLEIGTIELFRNPIPPDLYKCRLDLIPCGLDESQLKRVATMLAKRGSKGQFLMRKRFDYPGIACEEIEREWKWWLDLRKKPGWKVDLMFDYYDDDEDEFEGGEVLPETAGQELGMITE